MLATVLVISGEKPPENLANIKQGRGEKEERKKKKGGIGEGGRKGALPHLMQLRPWDPVISEIAYYKSQKKKNPFH